MKMRDMSKRRRPMRNLVLMSGPGFKLRKARGGVRMELTVPHALSDAIAHVQKG